MTSYILIIECVFFLSILYALSLLVLRHVSFHRWEDWPCEGSTFPRFPKLSSLLAQAPFIAQLACCVWFPLRIPPNGFKRVSWRKKKYPRAVVTTLLEMHGEQCWLQKASAMFSILWDHVNKMGPGMMVSIKKSRWTGCRVAGFLPWWMDTNSVRRPFHWVWGLENTLNYFNYTLQDSYGMNLTLLKFTWSCYLLHQWPRPGHPIIKILSFTHVHNH